MIYLNLLYQDLPGLFYMIYTWFIILVGGFKHVLFS